MIPRGQYIGKLLGDPPKDVAEPLKLRSSGLGSGIDKDRPDYTAFTASGRSGAFIRPARASAAARRKRPKGGQRSLRDISAELAARGHLNERGQPFSAASVASMLGRGLAP